MTTTSIRGLDHAVILVRDLDRARDTYRRLGFTLTPRGTHSLGSQNHCIMFGHDYLELMALPPRPPEAFQYFAEFLARGEGVGALALATEDAAAARAEFVRAGIAAEAPLALSRPVADFGEARFTLVQLPPAETPGFRTFICQHHTREIVWRPEYQRHANGAQGIASVSIATPDSSRYALLDGLPLEFSAATEARVTAIRLRVAGGGPGIVLEFG
jgi:catechol 2,3-dioxygenase-like lactoylglutathione lyase family enzyme